MENTGDANRIHSYDDGFVVINGERYEGTTVVMPGTLRPGWGPLSLAELTTAHADELLALDPELIVLGTGALQRFPAREFMVRSMEAGVGVEAMTTAAACRTYNVLIAEQRRALALLFMIEGPGTAD
ncbi:Mth938-like domain-containing protein [Natronocella acetinitrilica]|nr:Mth938-like domain-containing protein [Natronocella acetinitrilica]